MSNIEIKPGKWRMRNGECAVVEFKSTCPGHESWKGYTLGDNPFPHTWNTEGKTRLLGIDYDLIEPWIDKPVFNWAAMPAWAKWVAKDNDGEWRWHTNKPRILGMLWTNSGHHYVGSIPPEYAPSFTGNWRDSLVERPSA